jgi:hypothetical protein
MEITISNPELGFLRGDAAADRSLVPIRVIKAARLKLQLIAAMPRPDYLDKWKSLDCKSSGENYSVSIVENWRMDLSADQSKELPQIKVLGLWRT